jgi:HK97 family phage portal protein
VRVDADTALTVAAVFRGVSILAGTFAMLPLHILFDLPNGAKKRADDLPLDRQLSAEPNRYQDSFQWREMLFGHVLLRGNCYCRVIPGLRGPIGELMPLHPGNVTPERLPDGTVRYKLRLQNGTSEILNQDEVFHVPGLSSDGLTGISVVGLMRESLGLALATEAYGARFFSQNAQPSGILRHPGVLSEEANKRLAQSWQETHAGLASSHNVAVLEEGLDWKQVGMTSEDAQFLQTRSFQRGEIATWFGVPPHMLGDTEKSTSWGTGIEQQQIGFVVWTLLPWLVRFEQAINRQLITDPRYYSKFNVKGLLRGDSAARYSTYAIARQWGLANANECRALEDQDPIEGPAGTDYLNPLNFAPAGSTPTPRPAPSNGQALLLAHDFVSRFVGKEIGLIRKAAPKHGDGEDWQAWLTDFYGRHAEELAETLHIDPIVAARYAEEHRQQIAQHGVGIMEQMESEWTLRLAALALGGE